MSEGRRFDKKAFLEKHVQFQEDKIEYEPRELTQMLDAATELFANEPMLLELRAPIQVVGDTHGQYREMHLIFAAAGRPDERRYLFLGDYIDRGQRQLETICCLIAWRLNYPLQFKMLRWNHETRSINSIYGFSADLRERFGEEEGGKLWEAFNKVFDYMPVAALIDKQIFCMHGGFGPTLRDFDQIRKIKRPLQDVSNNPVAQDLLWADPCQDTSDFSRNTLRGVSYFYGENVVVDLCDLLKIRLIVRAHQMMNNGFGFFCNRRLVTIFSAPNYYGSSTNMSAIMTVSETLSIGFTVFNPTRDINNGHEEFIQRYSFNMNGNWGYVSRTSIENGTAGTDMTIAC